MPSSPLLHVAAPAWISGLLTHVWQSTVVALGILLLLALARRISARTRLGLAWLGLAKFALPAVWLAQAAAWLRDLFSTGTDAGAIAGPLKLSTPVANPLAPSADWTIPGWLCVVLVFIWLIGTVALLTGWAWRVWRTRGRLLTDVVECPPELAVVITGASERAGLPSPPRCLVGAAGNGPGVLGVRSPVIILPRGLAATLTSEELISVLLHECVHLRRRDNLRRALGGGLVALFWINPVVWLLHRTIGVETEKSCDERVLELTGDADAYAAGIVACVQHSLGVPRPVFAGVATPPVVERIRGILAYPTRRDRPMARRAVMLLGAVIVAYGGRAGSIAAETPVPERPGNVAVGAERAKPVHRVGTLAVKFQGEPNVTEQFVRDQMELRDGDEFDEARLDRGIRALYRTGKFATIEVKHVAVDATTFNLVVELVPKSATRTGGTLVLGSTSGTLSLSGANPASSRPPSVEELKKFFEAPQVEEAKLIRPVAPRYPAAARERGQGGQVVLSVLVDTSGTVASAQVVSSTDPIFEAPALEAVKRWAYQPVTIDGAPTMARITVPVTFRPETADGPASVRLPGPTPVQSPSLLAGPATSPSVTLATKGQRPPFRFVTAARPARAATGTETVHELSAVDRPPVAQFQARPRYPFQMRKQGITGEAVVDFVVNQEGEVVNAAVTRSSREDFEQPALDAVRRWKYRPGEIRGRAVNTHLQVPIVFTINPP